MTELISLKHVGSPVGEPLHYTTCGLDNVYLTSGYQVLEICGEKNISVRDVDDLHKAIAIFLIRRRKELAGKEIRFLRKVLDLTQRELGDLLGISDQSVARYEKSKTNLEGPADALLRLLVAGHVDECIDIRAELARIRDDDDCTNDVLTLEHGDQWCVAA